jgi:hypothetical protein
MASYNKSIYFIRIEYIEFSNFKHPKKYETLIKRDNRIQKQKGIIYQLQKEMDIENHEKHAHPIREALRYYEENCEKLHITLGDLHFNSKVYALKKYTHKHDLSAPVPTYSLYKSRYYIDDETKIKHDRQLQKWQHPNKSGKWYNEKFKLDKRGDVIDSRS